MRLWRATVKHFPTVNVTYLSPEYAPTHTPPSFLFLPFLFSLFIVQGPIGFFLELCATHRNFGDDKMKNANVNVHFSKAKIKSEGN